MTQQKRQNIAFDQSILTKSGGCFRCVNGLFKHASCCIAMMVYVTAVVHMLFMQHFRFNSPKTSFCNHLRNSIFHIGTNDMPEKMNQVLF